MCSYLWGLSMPGHCAEVGTGITLAHPSSSSSTPIKFWDTVAVSGTCLGYSTHVGPALYYRCYRSSGDPSDETRLRVLLDGLQSVVQDADM
jgi:hypothetical protein